MRIKTIVTLITYNYYKLIYDIFLHNIWYKLITCDIEDSHK